MGSGFERFVGYCITLRATAFVVLNRHDSE